MAGLLIGEVARRAGVAASVLRYYEKVGLLPPPAREGKRRQYDLHILGRVRIVLLARSAGFSVAETRTFLKGFPADATPALRWRQMAKRKITELDDQIARVTQMKEILDASFDCQCRTLEDCERLATAQSSRVTDCKPGDSEAATDPMRRLSRRRPGTC